MEQIDHHLYPKSDIKEADGVAWVATSNSSPFVMYPFKFKPLQENDVRIKILYSSVCHSDIMHTRQLWGNVPFPCCPGHEIIGQVTLVGDKAGLHKVGDVISVSPVRYSDLSCRYCLKGHTQMCEKRIYLYGEYFGGYATHMQIDQNWVFKVPQGLDLKEAPPLLCAGITVYAPLKRFQKIGGSCAVIGIGGLGHLAIQYANKLGMTVSAFTTKTNNVESLKSLGATYIEHSTNPQELAKNEGKYDLVISTLFIDEPKIYKLHQRLTKPKGVHIMVGIPVKDNGYEIDNQYLVDNQITFAGSNVGSIKEVQEMLQFSAHYNVKSINEHYDWQQLNEAFQRAENSSPRYRCVIDVQKWAKANGFDK